MTPTHRILTRCHDAGARDVATLASASGYPIEVCRAWLAEHHPALASPRQRETGRKPATRRRGRIRRTALPGDGQGVPSWDLLTAQKRASALVASILRHLETPRASYVAASLVVRLGQALRAALRVAAPKAPLPEAPPPETPAGTPMDRLRAIVGRIDHHLARSSEPADCAWELWEALRRVPLAEREARSLAAGGDRSRQAIRRDQQAVADLIAQTGTTPDHILERRVRAG